MANGLKYGNKNIKALKFDAPIVESDYEFDFSTWTLNPDNSDGVTVTESSITVTKVKPKEWFIRSNYGFTTASDRNDRFLNKNFRLSGLQALWDSGDITVTTDNPLGDTSQNYQPVGLIISPIRKNDGMLLSHVYPWDMNIPSGYYKHVYGYAWGGSWNVYGYGYDEERALYNWGCGYDNYPEVGFAFWTGADTDQDGYLTLSSPFTIYLENKYVVDPTTVEGYRASVGTESIYLKEKSYANVIQAHNLESEEHNTFTRPVNGHNLQILSTWNGASTAFVVDERAYSNLYSHVRLPEITDLANIISSKYPVKFWGNIEQDGTHPTIWTSIQTAFANTTISEPNFCQCLFANAKTNIPVQMGLNISMPNEENYINVGDILAGCSAISEVNFNIGDGALKSLHEAFIGTRNLSRVTFNKRINIADFSGTFEGSTLTSFPTNIGAGSDWQTQKSEPTCMINFAADGSSLTTFGTLNNADSDIAVINPYCAGAFARSNIQTIEYILDMKFVEPTSGTINYDGTIFNSVFGDNSALIDAKIINLNKGDWRLDGTGANGNYAGNLVNLNANSINYMLSNIFDLRLNTTEVSRFENDFNSLNGWDASAGTKRPIVWETWENSTLTKSLSSSGTMRVILTLINCKLKVNNTEYTSGDTELFLPSGNCTISFEKINQGEDMIGVIQIDPNYVFKSELTRNLSSANLYLPANAGSRIDSAALSEANDRGWNVYVGGTLYTI